MNDTVQRAYDRLPTAARVAVVNLAALRTVSRQRGWTRVLYSALDTERWSPATQRAYVAEQLKEVLEYAVDTVPAYWAMRPAVAGLHGAPTEDVFDVLNAFPEVTRQEVIDNPDAFLSRANARRWLAQSRTSGTTGTPLTVYADRQSVRLTDALSWRRTLWAGYQAGDWIARLVGDRIIPLHLHNPKHVAVSSLVDRRIYLSTYHLTERNAGDYVRELRRHRPAFVMGYPSALVALCSLVDQPVATASWRPKAVLYSSEPMLEHQRHAVEQAFRAPCRGFYGAAERLISASQCEYGVYHLSLLDGYLEGQFDPLARTSPRAVATTLANVGMPLIRYVLGDTIEPLGFANCRCGRTLPSMSPVVTKDEDFIRTPSGRQISPSIVTWAFKDVQGIAASQVAQVSADRVEVRLLCDAARFASLGELIRSRLSALMFGEMTVEIVKLAELPVTAGGKTRFVVDERRVSK